MNITLFVILFNPFPNKNEERVISYMNRNRSLTDIIHLGINSISAYIINNQPITNYKFIATEVLFLNSISFIWIIKCGTFILGLLNKGMILLDMYVIIDQSQDIFGSLKIYMRAWF